MSTEIKRVALEIHRAGYGGYIVTDARLHSDGDPYLHLAATTIDEALEYIRKHLAK